MSKTDDGLYWSRAFSAVEQPDGGLTIGAPISGTGISHEPPGDAEYRMMRFWLESDAIEPERRLRPCQPFFHVTGQIKLIAAEKES